MNTQLAKKVPQWAEGLTQEQITIVRREAIRHGKSPTDLVKEWVKELAERLTSKQAA